MAANSTRFSASPEDGQGETPLMRYFHRYCLIKTTVIGLNVPNSFSVARLGESFEDFSSGNQGDNDMKCLFICKIIMVRNTIYLFNKKIPIFLLYFQIK